MLESSLNTKTMLSRNIELSIADLEKIKAETGWLDAPEQPGERIQPYQKIRDWIKNNFIADYPTYHTITPDIASVEVPIELEDADTPDYEIFRNLMHRYGNSEFFSRQTEFWGGGVNFTVNENGSIVADMSDEPPRRQKPGWKSTLEQLRLQQDIRSSFLIDSYLANNRHRVEPVWYALFSGFRDFPVRYLYSGVQNGGGSMYLDVQNLPAQRDVLIGRIKKLTRDPRANTKNAQFALNYPKRIG